MCFKHAPELVHLNAIPGQQFSIGGEESRPVVRPVKFWKSFSAIDAVFVAIPSH
jgi:hypothetical protein